MIARSKQIRRWRRRARSIGVAALLGLVALGGCVVNPVPTPGPEGAGAVMTVDNGRKSVDAVAGMDGSNAPTSFADTASGADAAAMDAAALPEDATADVGTRQLEQ